MTAFDATSGHLKSSFPQGVRDFEVVEVNDFDFAVTLKDGSERFFRISYEAAHETHDLLADLERLEVADVIRQAAPKIRVVLTTTGLRADPS
jgi:hypothetical protein